MSKKPRTPAQLANDKRLAERARARKAEKEFEPTEVKEAKAAGTVSPTPVVAPPPVTDEVVPVETQPVVSPVLTAPAQFTNEQLMAMMLQMTQEMNQLKAAIPGLTQATPQQKLEELNRMNIGTARVTSNGVQGMVQKYSVDRNFYPDPTERLLSEPALARFAMKENYIFRWSVDGEMYEKDKVKYGEPRFTIELFRKLYDDEGQPTGQMALIARQMQHEDEMTVQIVAARNGWADKFGEGEEGYRQLMDEVRYWRMQQWLLNLFTPPKVESHRKRPLQQVIDGKVVEVYDTEELTDKDSGVSKASTLRTQEGVGKVATPSA